MHDAYLHNSVLMSRAVSKNRIAECHGIFDDVADDEG